MEGIGYCIDSDILIDYLRGLKDARVFLLETTKKAKLYISIVSITEIYSGKETINTERKKLIDKFLQNFTVIELDMITAKRAGELVRDYKKPFADMIIAASVLQHDLTLVTRNIGHFREMKNLKILRPY